MLQAIINWPWGTIWAAISALFTAATVGVAGWALRVWRQQEALKAKMALKMAVAEYSNALSQLPVNLESPKIRIEKRGELRELRHKLNAIQNAVLVCEDVLEEYPRVISCCHILPEIHKEYVRGSANHIPLKYTCKLILAEKFVFN
ncbi:hypothetical protein [Enterobacter kobei]|uniref:hypothetical protein n=1 Tax=Enterobacter kobei TaxID=208224 RepID=UPI002A7EA747|nr:hypothetical protein [Enterobacter kobei]